MNKLKELQIKIQEAVPEIKWRKCIACGHTHPQGNNGYCNFNGCQAFLDFNCEKGIRDITLEDVLIAMTLDGGSRFNAITYKRGQMRGKIQILREDQKRFIVWQPNKPLHEQSKETLTFLHNLLCVKR